MDLLAVDGGEWFDSMWLLWTVADLVEQNLFYRTAADRRTYRRDFRELVFFATAGTDGILFAFQQTDACVCSPHVSVWHPMMDELDEIAPSLEEFLRGWLTGSLSV